MGLSQEMIAYYDSYPYTYKDYEKKGYVLKRIHLKITVL